MSSGRPAFPDPMRAHTPKGLPRGCFLSFEGIEGSGKSTHAGRLTQTLLDAGHVVHLTREPGGSGLGEALRGLLLGVDGDPPVREAELFLMLASRAQHVQREILPRLNRGEIVISDRYADASLAYQGGGRGLDAKLIAWGNEVATYGIQPDLTVLVDVSLDEALTRVGRRRAREGELDRFDQETHEFYSRVQAAYHQLVADSPDRWRVVSSELPSDAVAEQVLDAVQPLITRLRQAGAIA